MHIKLGSVSDHPSARCRADSIISWICASVGSATGLPDAAMLNLLFDTTAVVVRCASAAVSVSPVAENDIDEGAFDAAIVPSTLNVVLVVAVCPPCFSVASIL